MIPSHTVLAEQRLHRLSTRGLRIAVVVPCYNVEGHLTEVVQSLPDWIHNVILVNDDSQDQTGKLIDQMSNGRTIGIHLPDNRGVGGAVMAGFERACELGAGVVVKVDGDGQMDPHYIPLLVEPLLTGKADYAKGNR